MNQIGHPAPDESSADKRVLAALRRMIIDGTLSEGTKISEVIAAEMFGVSRTPARLALRALEVEGLIRKRDGRGFTVAEFNLGDIKHAYEVRGVLEGLAAGTMAKTGISAAASERLHAAVEGMARALDSGLEPSRIALRYQDGNVAFHEAIMQECGNPYVGFTFSRMETLPMIKLGTVVFSQENAEGDLMRLRLGNMQHKLILDAIEKGDAQRAESMMREHANQTLVYTDIFSAPRATVPDEAGS
ncbi:GntR family transcriptional regulator [Nisaea acidiphila]|uniref:GntR family transcriptional regulator n=1 Tax=Nisaea acidiphila TaxID=1862145 RepID=A0A9J7AUD5_9PROT|nr:GntR family transcriptional regulator [Nisaea acidiphila]UUX49924.1 GntR family transcriptional regulator [Nisaea acidiphila]